MYRRTTALILCFMMLLLTACAAKTPEEANEPPKTQEYFSAYTTLSVFQDVPVPDMEQCQIIEAADYGDGYYVIVLQSKGLPSLTAFSDYIALMEQSGFVKYSSSGDTGIGDGAMLAASLQKGNITVSVTWASYESRFYISAAQNKTLSPHLLYDESYIADNIPGAQTTLTMHQLVNGGNCYVIQLKNGHYIVNDGGYPEDMEKLIESLKDGVPDGETPVVEAWFISHEHYDHVGVLHESETYAGEIIVEGFYSNQVSYAVAELLNFEKNGCYGAAHNYSTYYKTSAGQQTPVYRMHAGERYYFNDITIEIPHTCEQVQFNLYSDDLNTSCTWLMYHIEGQKFLLSGDTELENMQIVAGCFGEEYMDVDIMNVSHHGHNMYLQDICYHKAETLLYSTETLFTYWDADVQQQNLQLMNRAEEFMSYAEGGKKLTFPYTVGNYETIEPWYPQYTGYWTEKQNSQLTKFNLR